jgi:regulator of RNase E activity RraA
MDQGIKNANTAKLLGTAYTVKAGGDNLMVHRRGLLEPATSVIDATGHERSQVEK